MVKLLAIDGEKKIFQNEFRRKMELHGYMALELNKKNTVPTIFSYIVEIDDKMLITKFIYFGVGGSNHLPCLQEESVNEIKSFIEKNRIRILSGGFNKNAYLRLQM